MYWCSNKASAKVESYRQNKNLFDSVGLVSLSKMRTTNPPAGLFNIGITATEICSYPLNKIRSHVNNKSPSIISTSAYSEQVYAQLVQREQLTNL